MQFSATVSVFETTRFTQLGCSEIHETEQKAMKKNKARQLYYGIGVNVHSGISFTLSRNHFDSIKPAMEADRAISFKESFLDVHPVI